MKLRLIALAFGVVANMIAIIVNPTPVGSPINALIGGACLALLVSDISEASK